MKKIISLLLAVLMIFSVATVAFAEDADAPVVDDETVTAPVEGEEDAEDSLLGEYDWILDMPFWTVGPAFKLAKIALKLVKVYFKLGIIFGFIDGQEVMDQVIGAIMDMIASAEQPETNEPVEDATTEPAVA